MDALSPTEYARYGLYGLEWIMSVIVWGATSDKLLNYGSDESRGCYFGRGSNCGAIMFFGIMITLVLTGVIVAHVLGKLPRKIEAIIFVCFAALWVLLSLIASASAPSSNKSSAGNAVAVFSWFSIAAALGSALIAFYELRQGEEELNHDLEK